MTRIPGAEPVASSVGREPAERYGARVALVAGSVAASAVVFSSIAFNVIEGGPLIRWDGTVADALNSWVRGRRDVLRVLEGVSFLGRPAVLALIVLGVAAWISRLDRVRPAVFLVTTTLTGALLGSAVKLLVDRPRPVVDHPVSSAFGKSFPSGHAMHSTVVYGAVCLVLMPLLTHRGRRVLAAAAVAAVGAIGSSRLFLGVHFLTDVIGGFLLGGVWLAGGAWAFRAWLREDPEADAPGDGIGTMGEPDPQVRAADRAYGPGGGGAPMSRR